MHIDIIYRFLDGETSQNIILKLFVKYQAILQWGFFGGKVFAKLKDSKGNMNYLICAPLRRA